MKFIKIIILSSIILNTYLFALSNDMLADKYLISAKKSIKIKDYKSAIKDFDKIFDLGINVPNDIYYFYAKTLKNNNQLQESLKNFNLYLEKTGRSSKHYQEALGYIVEIENEITIKQKKYLRLLKLSILLMVNKLFFI